MAQQQAPIQPVIGALDEALAIGQQADAENNNAAPLPAAPALEANVSLDFGHPFYHLYRSLSRLRHRCEDQRARALRLAKNKKLWAKQMGVHVVYQLLAYDITP